VDTVEGRLDKTEATNVEANPEETEAAVDTVEGTSDKTGATNVEANPEETEAAVDTVEGRSDKAEATKVEANPKETEATVDWQDPPNKEINFDNIRVSGGPIRRAVFVCVASALGQEEEPTLGS
jgi:hypothetical protein